jgi:hypothetical protein
VRDEQAALGVQVELGMIEAEMADHEIIVGAVTSPPDTDDERPDESGDD